MAKPNLVKFESLIKQGVAKFTPFELYISDGLKDTLSEKLAVSPEDLVSVIDLDENQPVVSSSGTQWTMRFNGRLSKPRTDNNGAPLSVSDDDIESAIQDWASQEEITVKVEIDESLVRFSVEIPTLLMPDVGDDKGDGESEEDAPDSEDSESSDADDSADDASEEPSDDTSDGDSGDESPEKSDDKSETSDKPEKDDSGDELDDSEMSDEEIDKEINDLLK